MAKYAMDRGPISRLFPLYFRMGATAIMAWCVSRWYARTYNTYFLDFVVDLWC